MPTKIKNRESRVKVSEPPENLRAGGEARPFDYPHLYKIQAGDWRISYAVEHNRLAILVLEVLTPEEAAQEDPEREQITKTMKIKLLGLPDEVAGGGLSSGDVGQKMKIKFLDLSADAVDQKTSDDPGRTLKLRPRRQSEKKVGEMPVPDAAGRKRKITLRDSSEAPAAEETTLKDVGEERKVTPLDSPSS